jgi:uncharacterized cupin superfamily protein
MMTQTKNYKMNRLLILIGLIISVGNLNAQEIRKDSVIEPFKIEKRTLSGLDIPKQKLKDHPNRDYFQKRIYKGSELSIYILSSETAVNEITSFPIDEFVFFMNGRADIQTTINDEYSFHSGDYIFVPKGFSGNWTNNGGNKYHLELSVISNKRADSSSTQKAQEPFLLDRELISGIGLTESSPKKFSDLLYSGVELEVFTESEESSEKTIVNNEKEEFIHVLSGIVHIESFSGKKQTFYKGDFFILPKGFNGTWKSEGQNLFRILKVIQK